MRALAMLIWFISLFSPIRSVAQIDYVSSDTNGLVFSKEHCKKFQKRSLQRIEKLTTRIKQVNDRYLEDFIRKENAILHSLCGIDEAGAEALMQDSWYSYNRFENLCLRENGQKPFQYVPEVDTLTLAINFIESKSKPINGSRENCHCSELDNLKTANENLKKELKRSELITNYIHQRTNYLTRTLGQTPFARSGLNALDRTVHYYKEQLTEYQSIFSDRSRIEKLIIDRLLGNSQFTEFAALNGQLSLPSAVNQTPNKLSIDKLLAEFSESKTEITNTLMARTEMPNSDLMETSQIKGIRQIQRSDSLSNNANEVLEETAVDSLSGKSFSKTQKNNSKGEEIWKPNPLKTKRFIDRLNWGFNFQADMGNNVFPFSGTFALSSSYQLHKNSNFGLGSSLIVGFDRFLANSNEQIPILRSFESNGLNFRSFIDLRLRGAVFIQINCERNYRRDSSSRIAENSMKIGSFDWIFRQS